MHGLILSYSKKTHPTYVLITPYLPELSLLGLPLSCDFCYKKGVAALQELTYISIYPNQTGKARENHRLKKGPMWVPFPGGYGIHLLSHTIVPEHRSIVASRQNGSFWSALAGLGDDLDDEVPRFVGGNPVVSDWLYRARVLGGLGLKIWVVVSKIFLIFIPTWGNDPNWLIFFKGVGSTTNQ